MNIGDCSAKAAFRTASHTSREPCRATTWHTRPNESDSASCAALHSRLFTGDRYAVASLTLPPVLELPRCTATVGEMPARSCTASRTPRMCRLHRIRLTPATRRSRGGDGQCRTAARRACSAGAFRTAPPRPSGRRSTAPWPRSPPSRRPISPDRDPGRFCQRQPLAPMPLIQEVGSG